ncbi:serine-rich adhesin for platelets-like isoform X4 [Eriocheir sinensis]|uniref:serine-rich adhesin for platelets-like isoform X4 n=1 Tax=Eriocheir sinensis TaxID=95602 RepID=UPI0021C9ECD2|nr:serine-rich adhesin for platelets-like isoform X4 [Eriocheir sinensis]
MELLRMLATCLKLSCVEDEVELRVSEDEGAVEVEDASTQPAPHLRPPMFNPEDYALGLTKYSRMSNLYATEVPRERKGRGREKEKGVGRDLPQEMSLKQFSSLPELLRKLREDLKMSYLSFVKELVRDPHDGVSLLLDVLKMVQLAQTDLNGSGSSREQQAALRRALVDEHEALGCIRHCLRCPEAAPRLAHYPPGLYTLAVATMSNLARSRTLALQLLTKACMTSPEGHRQVVEALATLRLRFAEPVKCKFLVSMMLSHPHPSFQVWGLRFVNALLASTTSLRERVYLQEELTEAGFDPTALKKVIERSGSDHLQQLAGAELGRWVAGYVDVGGFQKEIDGLQSSNCSLQEELRKLREANMKLLEENVLLKTVGSEVEERYAALKRRLEHNGIHAPPSPVPSISDSDLSSLNTFRNVVSRRNSDSPSRTGDNRSAVTETDSVIFTKGVQRSVTPVMEPSSLPPTDTASTTSSLASDLTVTPARPVSSSSGPLLPSRSRHQSSSSSSTPDPRLASPLRSVAASPVRDESRAEGAALTSASPALEQDKRRPASGDKFNEVMPPTHIDMTFRNEKKSFSPEVAPQPERSRSPSGRQSSREAKRSSRSSSRQRQPTPPQTGSGGRQDREKRMSDSSTQVERRPASQSPPAAHMTHTPPPGPASGLPAGADKKSSRPPPSGAASPFSSSTSSLSSSSSTSSTTGGERKDPEYMNVPRRDSPSVRSRGGDETDLDYERDVVVYEAITLGNDRIFIDKSNTQDSRGSGSSHASTETPGSLEKQEVVPDGPNVRESVRHYENLVMMGEQTEAATDVGRGGQENGAPLRRQQSRRGEAREKAKESSNGDVSEGEVEAVMSGLENVLRSAESSLSLESQETVKENPTVKEAFEDRASPENTPGEELEIVPTRVPQLPARARSRNSQAGSAPNDPVLFLELETPAETSDTETLHRNRQPGSPHTIETESTQSFGFVVPDKSLRRRETFVGRGSSERESMDEKRKGVRRSESFQTGNGEYNSHRSYSPRRRGSVEMLVPLEEREVHISGRMFTKYTPHEVERRNRVNELITAEMNRRKNRSMEDRLDQWFEVHGGEGDWTLRWKYPEIQPDQEDKPVRQRSRRRQESRSPTRHDDNRRASRNRGGDNRSSSRHLDKSQPARQSGEQPAPPPKQGRGGKSSKFSNTEISAFNGFKNPGGFRESDYGPNFMLNKPPTRIPPDFADYGGRDFPPPRGRGSRERGVGAWRKGEIDPDIPTPDYTATPASTLNGAPPALPSKHILDMPSGLY